MTTKTLSIDGWTILRGGQAVVRDVSLTLHGGEILGLIGPNGAGKSTTIGGLVGLFPVASGSLTFQGEAWDLQGHEVPFRVRQQLAYIPEQPMYYADMTLAEHIEWKRRLWSAGRRDAPFEQRRLQELLARLNLTPHMDKFPHQCSKGTLQKLMVVLAFLFPFSVLVVDEPFIGLDVLAIRQVRALLASARDGGAAVLVSTHVLDSAERFCDRFAFMMDGMVFAQGTLADLRTAAASADGSLEEVFIRLYHHRQQEVHG
ncbi:ABC transporter ATP-binding protein [Alicyclobacillus cellulosilyticus]|uniref:ABC transporter ATP-binding protein n=1 Tax=Alicyclobacillus cellulosilyticus TaxID=1003997 RepID=A0A917K9J7_9BACL|nr:ABC transporter ATP-binding protein [Alicyclobacillus cellulosilyticus]GGJ04881.1 ABC transporter ATP-binding protein [Alicyclobacillus cellulosilyticus]